MVFSHFFKRFFTLMIHGILIYFYDSDIKIEDHVQGRPQPVPDTILKVTFAPRFITPPKIEIKIKPFARFLAVI